MDITVYLPDDIGKRAKEEELPLSGMLREAVITELERRETMADLVEGMSEVELDLEDSEGRSYKGRFAGRLLAEEGYGAVYLTEDERLIIYVGEELSYMERDATDEDAVAEVLSAYSLETVVEVMSALGLSYTVDI